LTWYNFPETFVEREISCCAPRFPLILATAKFQSLYLKESESGIGVGNFGKVGVGPQPWWYFQIIAGRSQASEWNLRDTYLL